MVWVLAFIVAVLLLAILGTMREVAILRSELTSFRELVTIPPEPEWFRKGRMPRELADLHEFYSRSAHDMLVVMFVSSGCPGCRKLVDDLLRKADLSGNKNLLFVTTPTAPSASGNPAMMQSIERAGWTLHADAGSDILFAAGVHGTPTAIVMDRLEAKDYEPAPDVNWVVQQLAQKGELV